MMHEVLHKQIQTKDKEGSKINEEFNNAIQANNKR
jgi:hypothetical protein